MEIGLPTALAVLGLAVVFGRLGRRRSGTGPPGRGVARARQATLILDVGDADPRSEHVRRLVSDARAAFMAKAPQVGGEDVIHVAVRPGFVPREHPAPHRTIAETLDLPARVRALVEEPEDPADVVRAVLTAAGFDSRRDGDVVQVGEVAVVALRPRPAAYPHDRLNHAYHLFESSGARSGIVIWFEHVDLLEVRRRELFAPEVRHAGPEAIQRMADAVAIGADPLSYAFGPPVVAAPTTAAGPRRR